MRRHVVALAAVSAASVVAIGLAPSASAADGAARAHAIVAKYSKNPTSIGNLPVIGKKIPKGKHLITIADTSNVGQQLNHFITQGGELLGWKVESISVDDSLEGERQGFQQAIDTAPDGIAVAGMETSSFGDLYAQAAAKGIAVVCSACVSKPGGGLLDSHIAGAKMLNLWGRMVAAYTVSEVKGTPNVQMFGTSVYPSLLQFDNAYIENLLKFNPDSMTAFNEFNFAGSIPDQVTAVYKANPEANFITSDLGDFFTGVPQALAAAGANPGVTPQVGGLTAGHDAIQSLKGKTTNVWTGYSEPIVGYSVVDSFARYWTKTPFAKANLPTQLLTQKTIGSAVLTPSSDYQGVKDYRAQFKKVWGLK